MTRVIHTGDTHVGYRQYNSPDRRGDFLRAVESVVDDAVAEGVDAVVHAGDLFHDRRPDLDDVLGVLAALSKLQEAGIPFLAVVGNHEATRGSQWLDLFERLGLAARLGPEPRVVGDVAFYGLDFVPESRRDDLDYRFAPVPDGANHAALVAHGQFDPLSVSVHGEAWDLTEVLAAATVAFDVALLGDEHAPDTTRVEGVPATYCGSTERVSAAEREGRGYNLVRFAAANGDGPAVDVRRRAIETRPFVYVSVDLSPGEGTDRVCERVREHDVADAVVIVEVTGDGEPVTPAEVESAALADGALIARVTDRRDREETEAAAATVQFADPDAAVRERLDEMGLSTAARGIDEVVREGKTADSNVREAVATEVRELVDDDDLSAFARAKPAGGGGADGDGDETDPDAATADGTGRGVGAAAADGGDDGDDDGPDGDGQSSWGDFA
jgi:DNA repair exonuclease SbcCD nuclease subunit